MLKLPKSKRGARRQCKAIVSKARRAMPGGLSYGLDMPTLRAWFPAEYAHIMAMRAIYQNLPE